MEKMTQFTFLTPNERKTISVAPDRGCSDGIWGGRWRVGGFGLGGFNLLVGSVIHFSGPKMEKDAERRNLFRSGTLSLSLCCLFSISVSRLGVTETEQQQSLSFSSLKSTAAAAGKTPVFTLR